MKFNQTGKFAEFIARMYMRCKGYHIIEKNYITGKGTTAGEIDFIAKKYNLVIFVEVKKRQSIEKAAYAISSTQKKRILRGAGAYLKTKPQLQNCDIRFDAILFTPPYYIKHIQNAWQEN